MSIIIKESDKKKLFEFIRWNIDHPNPCKNCGANDGLCGGCDKQTAYHAEYEDRIKDVPYSNMNYQKLADAYGRLYQAQKAQQEAIKACNNEAKEYRKVLNDYTILNDLQSIKAGDIIESIPHDLARCPEVQLSAGMRGLGYHLRHDVHARKYYVFKELIELNDPEYPYRLKYLGVFDKHEYANRAILEDRDLNARFILE